MAMFCPARLLIRPTESCDMEATFSTCQALSFIENLMSHRYCEKHTQGRPSQISNKQKGIIFLLTKLLFNAGSIPVLLKNLAT